MNQFNYEARSEERTGMKLMIVLIALAFIAILSVTAIGTSDDSSAANTVTVIQDDGLYYQLYDDNHAEVVSSYFASYSGDIVIKETVKYNNEDYSVTTIGNNAFSACYDLTSVDLNNVSVINYNAFYYCTGLTSIDLTNVTSIGQGAFYNSGLTSVDITNVTDINASAFKSCPSLSEFTVNGNVNGSNSAYSVHDGILYNAAGTELIQCPCAKTGAFEVLDNTEKFTGTPFYNCSGITSINLKKVTGISYRMFEGCTSIAAFTVSNENTDYSAADGVLFNKAGDTLFLYPCAKTGGYTVPNDITAINMYAFYKCVNLDSVDLNDVTNIGNYAFNGCTKITSVDLSNATTLGYGIFNNCTSLTTVILGNNTSDNIDRTFSNCPVSTITVNDENTKYSVVDGILFSKDGTSLILYPRDKEGSYTIPENVTNISTDAFNKCTGLTAINMNKYTKVGTNMFSGCTSMTTADLNMVTSIGVTVFDECTSLTEIKVNDDNPVLVSIDGVVFSKDMTTLVWYPIGKTDASYTVPDTVQEIYDGAFYGCTGLTSIDLKNVSKIGSSAFYGCTGLMSVNSGHITNISKYAFDCCASLKSIDLSNTSVIGMSAFYGCTGLTSVDLSKVTEIGGNAFSKCTGLTSVNISSVTELVNGVFDLCTGITSVTLPETAPSLPYSTARPFSRCSDDVVMIIPTAAGYKTDAAWAPYVYNMIIDISCLSIDAIEDQTYTGSALTPEVTVRDGTVTLVKDTDYTVEYSDNINAGTATVTVTGIGDYAGTKSANFNIVKSIKPEMVPDVDDQTYTGKEIKPVVVKDGDKVLVEGTDYTIEYTGDLVNTGAVFYEVTGKGLYDSRTSVASMFEIVKAAPSKEFFDYKAPSNLSYDGKEKLATVTLKEGITGTGEYVVTYSDNINVGTCHVMVAVEGGSNMEAGTFEIGTFEINDDSRYIAGATACIILVVAFVVLIGLAVFMYPKKP